MYKLFLVEDEVVVREGLRNKIDWGQYGFSYIGDAADGEMALPLIRETRPDVLITDIRMPFMDGLTLSMLVHKELPDTKIAIISGFDDFSYAQRAIDIGVDQYLLKPITKNVIIELLVKLKEKKDSEVKQKNYYQQFLCETREYYRQRFFEQLAVGGMPAEKIYEMAKQLNLNIYAQSYNLILLYLSNSIQGGEAPDRYTDALVTLHEKLAQFFMACPEYFLFTWSVTSYAVLVEGNQDQIDFRMANCVENICRYCDECGGEVDWNVAAGHPVMRLSAISGCFTEVNKIISYRYICPHDHVLTAESLEKWEKSKSANTGFTTIDTELLKKFLMVGTTDEVDMFMVQLLGGNSNEVLKSTMFSQYIQMAVYLKILEYLVTLGIDSNDFMKSEFYNSLKEANPRMTKINVRKMLITALEIRERESRKHYRDLLVQALDYIDKHYCESSISLNVVAKEINISTCYFSALFSKEVGKTFVEYLTQKRMDEACCLLQRTDMRSHEIADAVGYNDPHYFSFLFKKTKGCTPLAYRGGEKS